MFSGALQKLYFVVGCIFGILGEHLGYQHITFIPVYQWKGQLPKQLTTVRVNRKYHLHLDWKTNENNIADAIAIGDWYLNERKKPATGSTR